jgi:stage II sporulation protein D
VIVRLEGRGRRVRACYAEGGPRCRDQPELELSCEVPVVLATPGGLPRTFGHRLRVKAQGGRLKVTARVEVEGYVAAVVHKELGNAPLEAKKAQAILARTYAARAIQDPRHEGAPLCDAQHCQAFAGLFHSKYGASIDPEPAQSTLSEILIESDDRPTPVFFHATCGGRTVAANRMWPGAQAPDLVAIDDRAPNGSAWCKGSAHHRWRAKVDAAELARALVPLVERSLDPRTLRLVQEDDDGVVWRIGDRAGIRRVPGARLQSTLGRAFGYDQVRSARFTARRRGTSVVIEGEGLGHGVGLCQAGAAARAQAGQDAHAIIEAYFPKLRLKTGPWR